MATLCTRQDSYAPPDPEGDALMIQLVRRRRLQAAAHDNMRLRKRDGTVITPKHDEARCPWCKDDRTVAWGRRKYELLVAGSEFLKAAEAPKEGLPDDIFLALICILLAT